MLKSALILMAYGVPACFAASTTRALWRHAIIAEDAGNRSLAKDCINRALLSGLLFAILTLYAMAIFINAVYGK